MLNCWIFDPTHAYSIINNCRAVQFKWDIDTERKATTIIALAKEKNKIYFIVVVCVWRMGNKKSHSHSKSATAQMEHKKKRRAMMPFQTKKKTCTGQKLVVHCQLVSEECFTAFRWAHEFVTVRAIYQTPNSNRSIFHKRKSHFMCKLKFSNRKFVVFSVSFIILNWPLQLSTSVIHIHTITDDSLVHVLLQLEKCIAPSTRYIAAFELPTCTHAHAHSHIFLYCKKQI